MCKSYTAFVFLKIISYKGVLMKKIAVVLLAFSMFAGTVSAADSGQKATGKELVNAGAIQFEVAENSGLDEAASMSWGRIGQRVIVGASGLLLSQIAVEKLGSERVFGIAFGLSAAAVPAVWRETKIGFQELRISGKRKELCAAACIGVPLIVVAKLAGGLPVLGSEDGVKGIAANVGQLFIMAALNNAVKSRQDYLEELNALVSQKK